MKSLAAKECMTWIMPQLDHSFLDEELSLLSEYSHVQSECTHRQMSHNATWHNKHQYG